MSVHVPLGELRPIIGKRVDAAHYADEDTIITKNGQPHAVIVSYETYRKITEDAPNHSPLIHHKPTDNNDTEPPGSPALASANG